MRTKLIAALLLAFCTQHSMAQKISLSTLACGTAELRLGMSEKAVTDLLQSNGFSQSSLGSSKGMQSFYNRTEQHTCNVEFDKNGLVYVQRFWTPSTDEAVDAIRTFINAVQSVTRKGAIEQCEVFSSESTDPDANYRHVDTKCNGHIIGITLREDFKSKTSTFDISEEVGMMNEERKAMRGR